jgi:hypothetical protein
VTNGVIQAGNGIADTSYVWPKLGGRDLVSGGVRSDGNQRSCCAAAAALL